MKTCASVAGRRHFMQSGVTATLLLSPILRASAAELPKPTSLREELRTANSMGEPLIVMVSLIGCPFCKLVRDSYLEPLYRKNHMHIFQMDMQSDAKLLDFDGKVVSQGELIRIWDIRKAPTVLFFGPNGTQVAERLVGIGLEDFYGAYLDRRIDSARLSVRESLRTPHT